MSTFGAVRFRKPVLFLFTGRQVRLPSRRRALLAWGGGDCLDLFFLGLLLLPIAFLFASGHVNLLWSIRRLSPPGEYGLVFNRCTKPDARQDVYDSEASRYGYTTLSSPTALTRKAMTLLT